MKEFIKINDTRIKKTTIKKYVPYGERKINIYFSPSRNKLDFETFDFFSEDERTKILEYLDLNFLE